MPTRRLPTRRSQNRRRSARCEANACYVNRLSLSLLTELDHLAASGIEVTVTEEPGSRVRLSVKVLPAVVEECGATVLAVFAGVTKVPGFRPGKVPKRRLINQVGESHFWEHTYDIILNWTFPHAMSSLTERALTESAHIIPNSSDIDENFTFHHDYLRYDIVVDVVPEVKWNPENGYKNLKVTVEVDTDIDAQMACESEIKRLHKALGSKTVVTDRGLQAGDMAVLDISARKADNDEYVETIPPADKDFQLDSEETDNLLPGFLHSIMGIEKGERKSFSLVYPESWRQESLQGVEVKFVVECKELFCKDLPLLDDSLAERLLPGCNTLCQVRKSILQRLKFSESVHKELATTQAIVDQLCKMVDVDIPQFLFEQQGMQLFASGLARAQENLEPNEEEQLTSKLSLEAVKFFLEKEREHITNLVKLNLAVEDIICRENLQISAAETALDEFVPSNMQDYELDGMKDQVADSVKEMIVVLDFLRKHASIQYVSKGQRETIE